LVDSVLMTEPAEGRITAVSVSQNVPFPDFASHRNPSGWLLRLNEIVTERGDSLSEINSLIEPPDGLEIVTD